MRYVAPTSVLLVVALSVTAVVGLPFSRPPISYAWAALVFVAAYLFLRRFLSCHVGPEYVIGRNPSTLRKVTLAFSDVVRAEQLKYAGKPAVVVSSNDGRKVILYDK